MSNSVPFLIRLGALFSLGMSVALIGCGHSAINEVRSDFPCRALREEWVGTDLKKVTGCGMERVYGHRDDRWQSPAERASFELKCDRNALEMRHLGADTVGVTGCGQTVVYMADVRCEAGRCTFHGWFLNSTQR